MREGLFKSRSFFFILLFALGFKVIAAQAAQQTEVDIEVIERLPKKELNLLTDDVLVKAGHKAAVSAKLQLALDLSSILLSRSVEKNDPLLAGQAHYNRGAAYAVLGNHNIALNSFLLSLYQIEKSQDKAQLARIQGALGLIYTELDEYELAKPYFYKALNYYELTNDQPSQARLTHNLGFMKIKQKRFAEAKEDLLFAESTARKLGLDAFFPIAHTNLAKVETELGNTEQAIKYFNLAIEGSQIDRNKHHLGEIFREYAKLKFKLGDIAGARQALDKSFVISKEYKLLKQLKENYLFLADLEVKQDNYKAAYFAKQEVQNVLDKMGSGEFTEKLSKLEKYGKSLEEQNKRLILEQEKRIATLATEKQMLMKNIYVGVVIFLLLLVGYVTYLFRNKNKQAEHFEKQSKIDSLTGVWNRRAGEEQLLRFCARHRNDDAIFSIAMLDIDHFKNVNDSYGHDIGDQVIVETCDIIKESLRPSDMLCRWGGEEFVIILDQYDADKTAEICQRIRLKLESTQIKNVGNVTVSIGVAAYQGDEMYSLVKRVDVALYRAKEQGRNRVVVN